MRVKNRFVAATGAAVLMAGAAVLSVAGPASAVAPSGGCSTWFVTAGTPVEDTTPAASYLGAIKGAWSDELTAGAGGIAPNYTITSSGGSTVGSTRNFALTYDKGMRSFAAASGPAYWYFSVNGVVQPAITSTISLAAGVTAPGATINGSYVVTDSGVNNITFHKLIFDSTAGARVACSGQNLGTATVNPHTTPVDTNVTTSFTAVGPTAAITAISNQTVTNSARATDVVSFDASTFTGASGTAELCDTAGANCAAASSSFTISGGSGSGTITVPAGFTGAKALKLTSGSETALKPITILGTPTLTTNISGGGAGTTVTLTGTNWDPSQAVSIAGYKAGPPFPPGTTADPAASVTASATGTFSTTYTPNDLTTVNLGARQNHRTPPIFATATYAVSGDSCTAKVGAATTGDCKLLQTVTLQVTGGDLKMAQVPGTVVLAPKTLNGAAQTTSGSLQDVTVKDYRGGTLGWSLVGRFSGLSGPANIAASKMSWTPSCAAGTNNDDTVVTGSAAEFANATTDLALCSVSTGLGADAVSGGDATADAGLELALLTNQAAGNYVGQFTITLS